MANLEHTHQSPLVPEVGHEYKGKVYQAYVAALEQVRAVHPCSLDFAYNFILLGVETH
jgi:hypothetical protein